ncbi:hypothetical protein PInf_008577 [Phytophthora infestans]|nr:hypothetical protein PInf_008577 [Phytophthora infestans]
MVVAMLHPGWEPGVFSFMRSVPGGSEQEPHQDYQESDLVRARNLRPDGVPASMIFALEPGTKLRIYAGCFTARDNSKARVVDIPVEKGQAIRKQRFYCEKNPKGAVNKQKRKREYEEGEYKCVVCADVFKHQSSLRVHKMREHSA